MTGLDEDTLRAEGTDKLSFVSDRLPVGRRPTLPPHISKTQRRAAGRIDNVWLKSNAAPD